MELPTAAWRVPIRDSPKETVQTADRQSETEKRLRQIGLAFHDFHGADRKLPASKIPSLDQIRGITERTEKHPFSWRVAILPFVEQNELFEQDRFDEPWDSDHNLTLIPKMPAVDP